MKKYKICILFVSLYTIIFCTNSFAQRSMIEAMKLKFTIPKGFVEDKDTKLYRQWPLGGPLFRLVSDSNDVLIAINTMPNDTTEKGRKNVQWIKDNFNPKFSPNQNFDAYAKMIADSVNYPISRMGDKELKFYNADYGVEFTFKDDKNPYKPDYILGKAITMFKWNHGDLFLFYFFKNNLTTAEIDNILKRTRGFITY